VRDEKGSDGQGGGGAEPARPPLSQSATGSKHKISDDILTLHHISLGPTVNFADSLHRTFIAPKEMITIYR